MREISICLCNYSSSLSSGLVRAVEGVDLLGDIRESDTSLAVVLSNGLRLIREHIHIVLLALGGQSSSLGASEEVGVFLLREVNVIVPVRMCILRRVVPVILVERVRSQGITIGPVLELEIGDGSATVVVGHLHGPSVSLVVDDFSPGEPLLLLAEELKNVIGAHLHDVHLLCLANLSILAS